MKLNNKILGFIIIIFTLVIGRIYYYTYKLNNKKINQNVQEGFKGPKFKKKNKKNAKSKVNGLKYFGFKYDKEENFNNTEDRFQNALDEADRLDVNSLGVNSMKSILHGYNNNITNRLKEGKDENSMISIVNQGKVFIDEFSKLFSLNLFF